MPAYGCPMPYMITKTESVLRLREQVIAGDKESVVWVVRGESRFTVLWKPGLLEEEKHGHFIIYHLTEIKFISLVALHIKRKDLHPES